MRILIAAACAALVGCSSVSGATPAAFTGSGAAAASKHLAVKSYVLQYSKRWPKGYHWLYVRANINCSVTVVGDRLEGCPIDATIPSGNYGIVSIELYAQPNHTGCRIGGDAERDVAVENGRPYDLRPTEDAC